MRKLTENDLLKTSGEFTIKGKDGKNYSFIIKALFQDDSKKFDWCIARPNVFIPGDEDADSSLLFRVQRTSNPDNCLVELITDETKMNEMFDIYNTLVDEMNGKIKNKK